MSTDDFLRARINQMIDLSHPLAVLARRLPWDAMEAALAPSFARQPKAPGMAAEAVDLFSPVPAGVGAISNAERPRLPLRLMIALLYLNRVAPPRWAAFAFAWARPTWRKSSRPPSMRRSA